MFIHDLILRPLAPLMRLIRIVTRTKGLVRKGVNLCVAYLHGIIGYVRPPLPKSLNLMVTDVCNSRCKMCNVWTKKQEKELTPSELRNILCDPLFNKLNYVGVSGGEPTLRKDLPETFRVITKKKGIKGTGLITNAIESDIVLEQIEKCNDICRQANVSFNIMISLDGIGRVHDLVRGRQGNFESALNVIQYVQNNTHIPISIGCTVIKENVWHIDEVLDFCLEENIYGRFRIGEYINRLYNNNLRRSIRNFDLDERYQIALFFSKLELTYENNPSVRETYKNIRQMIFEGKSRQSGCPYRSNAVGLDSKGNLIYCSPKSHLLGSCLTKSAKNLYVQNIHHRASIIKNDCSNCIHDYHALPVKKSIQERQEEKYFRTKFSVDQALQDSSEIPSAKPFPPTWSNFKAPLIIGWYGTETAGDKAILGDIIRRLKAANPNVQIHISSIYPFVTKRTLSELCVENAKIIKTHSNEYLQACERADAVIMGGGPLMNMEALGFILQAFFAARHSNTPTIIEGCGIGPLIQDKYISAVKEILRLSTHIKVRDKASLVWITKNTDRVDATCSGDPAIGFVENWKHNSQPSEALANNSYFACFLREITTEYSLGMPSDDFTRFRNNFEEALGEMIVWLSEETGLNPFFIPMHTFVIGKDDRDFARRFAKKHFQGRHHKIGYKAYSPQDILSIMNTSRLNICMRFHSVLFAETLGVPFVAIDYTSGGKIRGFLEDRKKEELIIDRIDLADGNWKNTVGDILSSSLFVR